MISSKRPIVVYIEQARIPDETTSITRSEVPITGDIVVHHRIQNGANNKAMGDGFLKELYDVLNGAVGENLRFEDGASVFVYTSCARSIENYENYPGIFGKFYMCPYCGRIMTRNSMQVDHIISINLANEHRAYRILVPNDDINNIRNLTASCPECNNRKSDSGGGWIFLGRFGKYIFILIWAILLLSCLAFVLCCMSGTLKRGFLIPYVADVANVLLHWISDTIAQMFRFNT